MHTQVCPLCRCPFDRLRAEKNKKISLKIENALSGLVFSYGEMFNKEDDTIGDMKKKSNKIFKKEI